MNKPLLFVLVSMFVVQSTWASKPVANRAYVASGPVGVFYARAVPEGSEGERGSTLVFLVEKEADRLVDKYEWFNRNGVILAWSPIAGKVALMRLRQDEGKALDRQVEFSFYLGSKHLRSYTSSDLIALGAQSTTYPGFPKGHVRAKYEVMGSEQIPGTNEYVFSIVVGGKTLSFDILTGALHHSTRGK